MSDPTKPHIVGRWWMPGMWQAGGETPQWPQGRRYALHHAVVAGTTAYGAWLDGGLTVLDVADPTKPRLLRNASGIRRSAQRRTRRCSFPTATSSSSPTSRRRTIAPMASSASGCSTCMSRPIRSASPPCRCRTKSAIASCPANSARIICTRTGPAPCRTRISYSRPIAMRDLRVFDITDPFQPRAAGHFVPPPPTRRMDPRPNRPLVIQSGDVFAAADGKFVHDGFQCRPLHSGV